MFRLARRRSDRISHASSRRRPRGRRPWGLEGLEGRVLMAGNPTLYTVNLLTDAGTGTGNSGDIGYVITQVNGNTNPAGSLVQFDPTLFASPQTIALTGTLEISQTAGPVVIQAPAGIKTVSIDGQNTYRDFEIDSGVTAVLSNLTITGANTGGDGGGIQSDGTLTLDHCYVHDNFTDQDGGGIANTHILTVTDSVISSNSARIEGGGISNTEVLSISGTLIDHNASAFGGGLLSRASGMATVTDSRITANTGTGISDGGGIANIGTSQLALANCTLDANSAANGGGIENEGTLTAANDTIAYNKAGTTSGMTGSGGGIYNAGGTVTLDNTIVALNLNVSGGASNPDDIPLSVSPASAYNLIGTGGGGGLTNGTSGNQVGVANPGLGIAENNGGILPLIALLPGSPAIDKGSNALAVDPSTGQPLTTDGRGPGFERIHNGTVDIGAFEFGAGSSGGGGGGGGETAVTPIQFAIVKIKHRRAVQVTNPATGAVKFVVYPFGMGYHGKLLLSTADTNGDGVADLIARRPHGHKRFLTEVFSGVDGSLLPVPSNLA